MQWLDRVLIVALILVIAFATVAWIIQFRSASNSEVTVIGMTDKASGIKGSGKPPKIKVHVKGAVKKPGVYEFNFGERVEDAIKKAGGSLPTADLDAINLAAFLKDGEEVYVPDRRLRALEAFNEASRAAQLGVAASCSSTKAKRIMAGKVAINTATAEQLESLPGVGPALAQRIIEYRRQHGPFKSVDELLNVKGIGQKKLEALRPYVKLW